MARYKFFIVTYNGMWMGGRAVVRARDEQEAIDLVRTDARTTKFQFVEVTEVKGIAGSGQVLYNDDGDY